jgi:transcriptional regulator with XRE-family HTH domain
MIVANRIDAQVGRRLKHLRRSRCLTADELARRIDIEADMLRGMEAGARIPADILLRLCTEFRVSAAYFLDARKIKPTLVPPAESKEKNGEPS